MVLLSLRFFSSAVLGVSGFAREHPRLTNRHRSLGRGIGRITMAAQCTPCAKVQFDRKKRSNLLSSNEINASHPGHGRIDHWSRMITETKSVQFRLHRADAYARTHAPWSAYL